MKRVFKNLSFVFLFAVISILGLTSVNAESKNIEVTDIRVINMSDTITVSKPTISNGEISSSIKFNELNDFVTFELTLKNNESDKYKIVSITDNKENDNVDIEYNYNENYIGKDEITKVTIKMTYKNKLVNKDLSLDDLSITLGLEKEDGSSSRITINPQTGDNILHYVALFIISGLGLFFVITKKRIKGFKVGNLLLIISVILIPFTVLANEKFELSLKFSNSIEVKGEFEVYDISIDSDNDEDAVVRKITYGEKIGDLPEVSKTGYNFVRWEDKDGNEITENTVITKPIEVKAKYNIIEYEITYDLNNGKLPSGKTNPTKYTVESDDITLVNPEMVGYTFAGWTENDIDEKQLVVTIEKGTIGDKSYVAHYTANDDTAYKVIHKIQKLDGTYAEKETENKKGTTDENVTPAVNTYTGFTSPLVQTKKIKGDGTTEFVYEYTRNKYQLTIEDAKYVEQDKSGKHYYEEEITLKAKTRSGYTFAGWSNGSESKEITITMGTEDITIKPLYTANTDTTYTVIHKYKKLDNTYETVEKTEVGKTDDEVDAPIQPKYGFVNPEVQKVKITGDGEASVTYIYERAKFQFSITDRTYLDSTSTPNGEYPYETEITLKAITKDGYTFKWNDDVTDYERTFNLNADNTSLSLIYTANKYNVVFNKNSEEATGEMVNQELTYDTAKNLTKNSFERLGYTFDGWNTKIDGTGTSYADEEEVINLVKEGTFNLFAKWKANTNTAYKIIHKYKKLDNTFEVEEVNDTGTTNTTISAPIKHKDHFIDPVQQNITIAPDGEASVTYIYERESYTVTFNTNGGSNIDSQTVLYEAKASRPEGTPYLFDREFDDWYTDSGLETKFDFENTKITADTVIYAKYIDTCNGFSSDSWSTIKANVENDPNHYPLGCRKEVQLDMDNNNTPETYKVRIANRSTPNVCATEGYSQTACGFVLEFEETVGKRRMNNSDTVAGGWKETEIVTYLNGEFYNKLPSDLKNAIIPTYPIVSGSGNDLTSDNITEEDTNKNKIYFFSTREVGFGGQFDNKANIETDTRVLDYYIGTAENSSHEDRRVKYNLNNAAQYWMLRTADLRDDNVYLAVSKGGALSSTTAGENYAYNYAMAPAFRIATLPKYTVIFDSNGGSGSMTNQGIYSGVSTKLSLNTFTASENMIFDSWNTKEDGSGISYSDGEEINLEKNDGETITLYAQWRPGIQTWSMTSDNVHVTDGYITLEVGDQITGYSVDVDNTTYGDGDWFVMGAKDGKLLITLKLGVGEKVAKGNALNWPSFVANLDSIASHYKNPTYADNSRSINLSDINRVTGFTPYEMESITFTNDNGIIRTKDIPDELNVYPRDFYYYDFESSSWKKLGNGSSISFASNGYKYGPDPGQNNVNGSEKAYDLIFKDTHDKNWMIDGHVVTYRGNQYWLADAVIMTSSGQGMIYYCFQYIDWEIVDWAIAGASSDNPANSSYSEFDNFVRPVVTLKSEVHVNASGTIIN